MGAWLALKQFQDFKSQIKGQRKKEFDKLYEKLKSKVDEKNTDLQHFEILSELVGQINDNHFVLQYIPDTSFDWKRYFKISCSILAGFSIGC